MRVTNADGSCARVGCARNAVERPEWALKRAAAQGADVSLEGDGLVLIGGDLSSRQEPIELVFADGAGKPAQDERGAAREAHLAERNAERELKERVVRMRVANVEEGALDFTTACGQVVGNDEEGRVGVGGEQVFCPESAGSKLGLSVGSGVKAAIRSGRCLRVLLRGLLRRPPGVKESALRGENTVKADEKQWRALR